MPDANQRRPPQSATGSDDAPDETDRARQGRNPTAYSIYRAAIDDGHEQLGRGAAALAWSGLAAGLTIGFSLIARGLLRQHLPDAQWRPLVVHLGYTVGFILVVLSRQQMISGNTVEPVLVLLRRRDGKTLAGVLRLWSIVFVTNMLGTLAVAAFIAKSPVFDDASKTVFGAISSASLTPTFGVTFLRAIFAGWLIGSMVWILHSGWTSPLAVVALATYVISLGQFSQVIAGAVDAFYAAVTGAVPWGKALGGYILPSLIGNLVGGVALVAGLNYGQAAPDSHEA